MDQDPIREGCRQLIALCVQREFPSPSQDLTEALEILFGTIARLLAAANGGWSADSTNPGYLLRTGGGVSAAVPFHLVGDFPNESSLTELAELGGRLRVGARSTICLSGSAVFLTTMGCSGDLDYCEYVPVDDAAAFDGMNAVAAMADNTGVCLRLRLGHRSWARPWDAPPSKSELEREWLESEASGRHGKLDSIVLGSMFGAIEATNVVIWSDANDVAPESPLNRSFALQEAPLSKGDITWIPRKLADPANIRRYVQFLCEEIRKYRSERPVKALKRALSLAVFMQLQDDADRLRELLRAGDAVIEDVLNQRRKLLESVSRHAATEVAQFGPAIGKTITEIRNRATPAWAVNRARSGEQGGPPNDGTERFSNQSDQLVSNLLTTVAQLTGEAYALGMEAAHDAN